MEKRTYFGNIDRRTGQLIIDYTAKTLDGDTSLTVAKVMQGVAMEALGAGVALLEHDVETLQDTLPYVGGIGLYAKASIDVKSGAAYPPVIYLVRNKVDKDSRIYCSPGYTNYDLLIKFLRNATFPIYELAVMAHELGHHISATVNPGQCFKRDAAWTKFISLDTRYRTLDLIGKAGLGWKLSRSLKKSTKKKYGKKRVTNKDKLIIYEEEKKAWCYGYKVLKRVVSRSNIKNAQVVFDFYIGCRNIALENYKKTLWPKRRTIEEILCSLFPKR